MINIADELDHYMKIALDRIIRDRFEVDKIFIHINDLKNACARIYMTREQEHIRQMSKIEYDADIASKLVNISMK